MLLLRQTDRSVWLTEPPAPLTRPAPVILVDNPRCPSGDRGERLYAAPAWDGSAPMECWRNCERPDVLHIPARFELVTSPAGEGTASGDTPAEKRRRALPQPARFCWRHWHRLAWRYALARPPLTILDTETNFDA